MALLPPGFEHHPFYQHFCCPWCGYTSGRVVIEKIGWNPISRKALKPRYWCEKCNRYSRQSYPTAVGFVWGFAASAIALAVIFGPRHVHNNFDDATTEWLLWILAVLICWLVWPVFSRQCSRYERATPSDR